MKIYKNGEIREATTEEIQELAEQTTPPEIVIAELQKQLTESDYKIIKCYEYSLAGVDLPYNIEDLHKERQAIRDKINELQN